MQKVMRRKAPRNLDVTGASTPPKSFTSFSSSRISANLSSVGVSLGNNANDIIISTSVLRHMEYDRLNVIPKVSYVSESSLLDEEEANDTVDGQLLCSLVGVVSEVGFNETGLDSLYELRASGRKSKSSLEKKSRKCAKFTKSLNSFQMNGIFKNSRGLRDLAKH
jgi:hypothetical protein